MMLLQMLSVVGALLFVLKLVLSYLDTPGSATSAVTAVVVLLYSIVRFQQWRVASEEEALRQKHLSFASEVEREFLRSQREQKKPAAPPSSQRTGGPPPAPSAAPGAAAPAAPKKPKKKKPKDEEDLVYVEDDLEAEVVEDLEDFLQHSRLRGKLKQTYDDLRQAQRRAEEKKQQEELRKQKLEQERQAAEKLKEEKPAPTLGLPPPPPRKEGPRAPRYRHLEPVGPPPIGAPPPPPSAEPEADESPARGKGRGKGRGGPSAGRKGGKKGGSSTYDPGWYWEDASQASWDRGGQGRQAQWKGKGGWSQSYVPDQDPAGRGGLWLPTQRAGAGRHHGREAAEEASWQDQVPSTTWSSGDASWWDSAGGIVRGRQAQGKGWQE